VAAPRDGQCRGQSRDAGADDDGVNVSCIYHLSTYHLRPPPTAYRVMVRYGVCGSR
jgi:hypothetical protein